MKFKPFRHPFRFFRILRFVWKARKPSTVHDMPAVVENPYRCHHVRRPKHVAHQRWYGWSRTLFASEWVRHWYAMLRRVGLIATVRTAWSDTNNFQCLMVFKLTCCYVYMYTYNLEYIIIHIHVFMYKKHSDMVLFRIFLVSLQPIRYYCTSK